SRDWSSDVCSSDLDLAELLGLGGVHVGDLLGGSGGSGLGAVEDRLGAREDPRDLLDAVAARALLAARLRVVHAAAALETAGEDARRREVAVDAEPVPGQPLRALARLGVAGDSPGDAVRAHRPGVDLGQGLDLLRRPRAAAHALGLDADGRVVALEVGERPHGRVDVLLDGSVAAHVEVAVGDAALVEVRVQRRTLGDRHVQVHAVVHRERAAALVRGDRLPDGAGESGHESLALRGRRGGGGLGGAARAWRRARRAVGVGDDPVAGGVALDLGDPAPGLALGAVAPGDAAAQVGALADGLDCRQHFLGRRWAAGRPGDSGVLPVLTPVADAAWVGAAPGGEALEDLRLRHPGRVVTVLAAAGVLLAPDVERGQGLLLRRRQGQHWHGAGPLDLGHGH